MLNTTLLTFFFVIVGLFSALSFGKVFQMRTYYRIKSPYATIVSGLSIYFLFMFILLSPTLFIAMSEEVFLYYFITCLSVVGLTAIILFITIRKLFRKAFLDWGILILLAGISSVILIFPNLTKDISFQTTVLVDDAFDKILFDPFDAKGESFLSGWIRMLSGWLTIFSSANKDGVFALVNIGVPILFSFYLVSIMFLIGTDVMKWNKNINRILSSSLVIILVTAIALIGLDVTLGFMLPLLVLLTGLVLFFYRANNVVRGKGISILIALVFNLAFLIDFNTWAISCIFASSLIVYQGFKFRAISLRDALLWLVTNGINLSFIFSNSIVAVIVIVIVIGSTCLFTIRALAKGKDSKRFILENRVWRYQLLIAFLAFASISISSLVLSSAAGESFSLYNWLDPSFWGDKFNFTSSWTLAISIVLGILVLGLIAYTSVFFLGKIKRHRNHLFVVIVTIIILFFNPLVAPMYSLAETPNTYFYGFIFLSFILFLAILSFFSEIKDPMESKFLFIAPILIITSVSLVSYLGYVTSLIPIKMKDWKQRDIYWKTMVRKKNKRCSFN